jgi:hypothetical protein
MACHAASFCDGWVVIHERSREFPVTLEAHQIVLGAKPRLLPMGGGMWSMAISALHGLAIHFMMNGHGELLLDVSVTLEAEPRLRFLQQSFFSIAVDNVALDAAYVACSVS